MPKKKPRAKKVKAGPLTVARKRAVITPLKYDGSRMPKPYISTIIPGSDRAVKVRLIAMSKAYTVACQLAAAAGQQRTRVMSKVSYRTIPKDVVAAINAHNEVNIKLDGTSLYSVLHLKGSVSETSKRYVVYIHNNTWPIAIWDFGLETWYHNTDSYTADDLTPQLVGETRGVNKYMMVEIASRGVAGAVQRKLEEVTGGSK